MSGTILNLNEIGSSTPWNRDKSVIVGGCFDLIHYGHITFLNEAKKVGDVLIVALEPDEFIKTVKNREPFHNQDQRAEILASLRVVDYVIKLPLLKGFDDYSLLIQSVKPKVIAVTDGDPFISEKQRHAESVGAEVHTVTKLLSSFSTSRILKYARISSN